MSSDSLSANQPSPTILIIGRNGQVGYELVRALSPIGRIVSVDYPEIDLTSPDSIIRSIQDTRPQVVINAAAYTAVDKAESEAELAMKINGVAPGVLAEEAKKMGALLVHYSTDYVYDGTKNTPYIEDDPTGPLGAYGKSKLSGDQAIQAVDGKHLIFRLCWVYGARGQNFMLTMLRLAREREKLRVINDQFGAPTWSRMIAETTSYAIHQVLLKREENQHKGIYHLCSSGMTSWHGFAEAIIQQSPQENRKCRVVEAIPTSEYPTPAKRPVYSGLNCEKLKKTFGLCLPYWEDCLKMVLADMRK